MDWKDEAGKIVAAVTTLGQKTMDDSFRDNAENASAAGLEVRVTRTYDGVGLSNGRECQWCKDRECADVTLAEAYRIGAFQRHEGCECIVEYTSNKGVKTIQTGKYSGWNYAEELEKRKSIGLNEQFFADELISRVYKYITSDLDELIENAISGKRHASLYTQSVNKPRPQLEKAIRKHIREAEEHEWKIQHPERWMKKQDPNDPIQRKIAVHDWEKHRQKNAEEAALEIEVWRRLYGQRI